MLKKEEIQKFKPLELIDLQKELEFVNNDIRSFLSKVSQNNKSNQSFKNLKKRKARILTIINEKNRG